MEYNKIPPQDIEAEKSLLCCIMIDKYWHDKLEDRDIEIKSEYFYDNKNSILFNIIQNIYDKDITVDWYKNNYSSPTYKKDKETCLEK